MTSTKYKSRNDSQRNETPLEPDRKRHLQTYSAVLHTSKTSTEKCLRHNASECTFKMTRHETAFNSHIHSLVIVITRFLKRYSKSKRIRAPAYSRALRRIKGGFQMGVKRSSGTNSRIPAV